MTYRAVLRGYLLEEALAWLLRNTGYRLLVHASQDPDELIMAGNTLLVQGRGTTHQVSLVDISGVSFEWLRHRIASAAAELYARRNQHHVRRFPVSWMRRELRARLGTALPGALVGDETDWMPDIATNAPHFRTAAEGIIETFAAELVASERSELLLGFPAAPFILVLGADDPDLFIEYAEDHPTHAVRLRRVGSGGHAEWSVSSWADPDAYRLAFNLPERVETWISENEERRFRRANSIKSDFLSEITIYRRRGDDMRIYQLRYEPTELHRPAS